MWRKFLDLYEKEDRDKALKSLVVYKMYQVSKEIDDIDLAKTLLLLGSLLADDPDHSRFLYNKFKMLNES